MYESTPASYLWSDVAILLQGDGELRGLFSALTLPAGGVVGSLTSMAGPGGLWGSPLHIGVGLYPCHNDVARA